MSKRKSVKFRRGITGLRLVRNPSGSKLVEIRLSCGHATRRAVRNSHVKGGMFRFGCDALPCRECRRTGARS